MEVDAFQKEEADGCHVMEAEDTGRGQEEEEGLHYQANLQLGSLLVVKSGIYVILLISIFSSKYILKQTTTCSLLFRSSNVVAAKRIRTYALVSDRRVWKIKMKI